MVTEVTEVTEVTLFCLFKIVERIEKAEDLLNTSLALRRFPKIASLQSLNRWCVLNGHRIKTVEE